MPVEVRVPEMGESISQVQIGRWLKGPGESVTMDEPVVELESDKATVEVPAPAAGTLARVLKQTGESAGIGEVIAYVEEGVAGRSVAPAKKTAPAAAPPATKRAAPVAPPRKPAASPEAMDDVSRDEAVEFEEGAASASTAPATLSAGHPLEGTQRIMPAARRVMAEYGLSPQEITPTGPGGRIQKADASRVAKGRERVRHEPPPTSAPPVPRSPRPLAAPPGAPAQPFGERDEEVVPMTPIRRKIAERLVQAQQTAALLTTFNEIDMSAVIALRDEHKREFVERHGVKLGFMSFFIKATVAALRTVPQINAEIQGADIVYHKYYDIGVAIGGGKGLVVPVLRNADRMSFTQIEKAIADFAARASENKIGLDELQGGTFTISNGGIYGSLLSTPIVNPPQSGILGMHAIQERPVAVNGQVVIRPMMYVALTYDHRIVDGKEAVLCLRRIKDGVENPARLLLEV